MLGFCIVLSYIATLGEFTLVVAAKEKKTPGCFGATGAYAQAYGLFNTAYAAGTLVGPLWGGLLVDGYGWSTMIWTLGVLSAVMGVGTCFFAGEEEGRKFWKREKKGDERRDLEEGGRDEQSGEEEKREEAGAE